MWDHGGSCRGFVFQLEWIAGQKEQRNTKNQDLCALCFYSGPKEEHKSLLWELVWFCLLFIHWLLTDCRSTAGCTWGLKRPTTLSFSSHTFCWSHLRFSVIPPPHQNTIQWVLRHFLQERKEQSVILCNNNIKKNYRPLSRKKSKKVSLRISVRWPAEAAGVSVKVRDAKHPLEESQRSAEAPCWPADQGPNVRTLASIVSYARSGSMRSLSCRFGIVVFFT